MSRVAPGFAAMTANRLLRRLRAQYFAGPWNPGSVRLAAALVAIAAAAFLAALRKFALLGPGWGLAEGASLAAGVGLLATAGRYDARRTAREPISRRCAE